MAKGLPLSPLAPESGFPDMPVIDGVRFAAVEAGVRHAGRKDVMLAEIAPGSSVAGVFTRSATRAAPVLWCQQALTEPPEADPPEAGPPAVPTGVPATTRSPMPKTLPDASRRP